MGKIHLYIALTLILVLLVVPFILAAVDNISTGEKFEELQLVRESSSGDTCTAATIGHIVQKPGEHDSVPTICVQTDTTPTYQYVPLSPLPQTDEIFNLGDPQRRWKDLYFENQLRGVGTGPSIHLEDDVLPTCTTTINALGFAACQSYSILASPNSGAGGWSTETWPSADNARDLGLSTKDGYSVERRWETLNVVDIIASGTTSPTYSLGTLGTITSAGSGYFRREPNTYNTTSIYTALILDGGSTGALYAIGRADPNNEPFTALNGWDSGAQRILYYGGGGWSVPDATQQFFYVSDAYTETNNTGIPVMHLDVENLGGSNINPLIVLDDNAIQTRIQGHLIPSQDNTFDLGATSGKAYGRRFVRNAYIENLTVNTSFTGVDMINTSDLDDAADTPAANECLKVASTTSDILYEECATSLGGRSLSVDTATSPDEIDADVELYENEWCDYILDPNSQTARFLKAPRNFVITGIDCLTDTGTVDLLIEECDGNGGTCGTTENFTGGNACANTNTSESGGVDDPNIDVGDWMQFTVSNNSAAIGNLAFCITYEKDD